MPTKKPTVTVELTAFEAESMFLAGPNYTPARRNAGLMNPVKRPAI